MCRAEGERHKGSPRWWAWQIFEHVNGLAIPINIEEAAEICGSRIYLTNLGGIAGYSNFEDGRHIIYVNILNPLTRRRFTIAHEFGHFVMKHKPTTSGRFNAKQEREANLFAAEVLMPGPAAAIIWGKILYLEERIKSISPYVDLPHDWKVRSFALRFQVSKVAAQIRLRCLKLGGG